MRKLIAVVVVLAGCASEPGPAAPSCAGVIDPGVRPRCETGAVATCGAQLGYEVAVDATGAFLCGTSAVPVDAPSACVDGGACEDGGEPVCVPELERIGAAASCDAMQDACLGSLSFQPNSIPSGTFVFCYMSAEFDVIATSCRGDGCSALGF